MENIKYGGKDKWYKKSYCKKDHILHHNVPSHFWGDALLIACYLTNRIPSSVLQDQIPYSTLNPQYDLYPVPLRFFGCTCFVHDLSPGKYKLSAKSLKCIFLGYSHIQKGYHCFFLNFNDTLFSMMLHSLKVPFFFSASMSHDEICNSEVRDTPYVIPTSIKPPLEVYQWWAHSPTKVRDDINPLAPRPAPTIPPTTSAELDLLIT